MSSSPKAVASEDAWQQYGGASANGGASVKETAAKKSLTRPPVARRCRETSEFASKQLREKTPKQLRELHEDLRSDMATLRAVVRRRAQRAYLRRRGEHERQREHVGGRRKELQVSYQHDEPWHDVANKYNC